MYLEPTGDRLSFGDVIEAAWLYDIYLRPDSVSLEVEIRDGRIVNLTPRKVAPRSEPQPPRDAVAVNADFHQDWALAFGAQRGAIVLTDDCELETLYGRVIEGEAPRKPRGRIMFAAVKKATGAEIAAVNDGNTSMFALPAQDDDPKFSGGIVDLGRTFTVNTKSLIDAPRYQTLVSLDVDARVSLSQRWDAYAARHGPLIAAQMSFTFAQLLDADGRPERVTELRKGASPRSDLLDVADGVAAALTSAWTLEGPIGDRMLAAWEAGHPSGTLSAEAVAALESIRSGADAALAGLGQQSWRPTSDAKASRGKS